MHRHRQRPWCCTAPVSSVAMADGNAALRDVASSQQRCNSERCSSRGCSSRGYKLATLQQCCCFVAMASRTDGLLCSNGRPGQRLHCFVAMVPLGRRLRCSVAMVPPGRRLRCSQRWQASTAEFFVFFYSTASTASFMHEKKRITNSSTRKRERKKEN
jgi:hypothetical protein